VEEEKKRDNRIIYPGSQWKWPLKLCVISIVCHFNGAANDSFKPCINSPSKPKNVTNNSHISVKTEIKTRSTALRWEWKRTRNTYVGKMKTTENIHFCHCLNCEGNKNNSNTKTWANAQCDGRSAEHRWRPLCNATKFGWRPLLECCAVTLPT